MTRVCTVPVLTTRLRPDVPILFPLVSYQPRNVSPVTLHVGLMVLSFGGDALVGLTTIVDSVER